MEVKQEEIKEEAKKAKVSSVRKKAEDLPEIADYERPELEKYEKMDFTPSTREKPEKDKVHKGLHLTEFNTCKAKVKSNADFCLNSDLWIL